MDVVKLNEQVLMGLQTLKGTIHEKDETYDVSMNDWSWPQGVALFAMFKRYQQTHDQNLLNYIESWFDQHIRCGLPPVDVNNTCPMLTMAYLYEETQNQVYLPLIQKWCDDVIKHMPRTEEGGIAHYIVTLPNDGQLWDDTLYMTVLFIAKMGQLFEREELIQESVRQFLLHIKYLNDVTTGLFYHGWNFNGRHHFGKVLWGRGNSWYTAGLVDYLELVNLDSGVKEFLLSTLQQQVAGLMKYQHPCGLWHTVINDDTTYLESSASAAFAYGILKATRLKLLSAEYREVGLRAANAVIQRIDANGTLQGVSAGTPVFMTVEEYNAVEIHPMPYGQSMALLILNELCY